MPKGKYMIGKADMQNLIKKVFCLLAGIQILLGLFWLAGNVVKAPLSIVAVFVAWRAYAYFLKHAFAVWGRGERKKEIAFWATYIVTFPMIMHCHAEDVFFSLGTSCFLIFLTEINRLQKKDNNKKLRFAFLLLAGILAISGMWSGEYVRQKEDGKDYKPASISSIVLSRFAWPYFMRNSFFWAQEVRETFSDAELIQISTYPELVKYEFEPKLEQAVGTERAKELYRQMAWDSFRIGKKDAIKDFGRDLLANAAGPWAVQYQLDGKGVSYTGKNYADMSAQMPELTRYYVTFSLYSFDFMAVLAIVISIIRVFKKKLFMQWRNMGWMLLFVGILVLWYTMVGNGMQDYLKITSVFVLWCSLPALGYGLLSVENEQQDEVEKV